MNPPVPRPAHPRFLASKEGGRAAGALGPVR